MFRQRVRYPASNYGENWLAAVTAVTLMAEQSCFALLKGPEAVTSSAQWAKIADVVEIVPQPIRVFSERDYVVHLRIKRLQMLLAHGTSVLVLTQHRLLLSLG